MSQIENAGDTLGPQKNQNIALAKKIIIELYQQGVREFCLCAGARNSPLVVLLSGFSKAKIYHFFEERSAAFFALGRIQQTGNPVAVVTTSGTAVAELLPATVEAYYSGWPLVLVTADRPRSYRGTGAPQSIEQAGIFGVYVDTCLDIESCDEELNFNWWTRKRALQVNVCFAEPLLDGHVATDPIFQDWVSSVELLDSLQNCSASVAAVQLQPPQMRYLKNPLVIAGNLSTAEKDIVVEYIKKWKLPVYAESLSNLRGVKEIESFLLKGGEKTVSSLVQRGLCQSILRVGGVPTLRLWRDLEEKLNHIPVYSVGTVEFSGLSRSSFCWSGLNNLQFLQPKISNEVHSVWWAQIQNIDAKFYEKISEILWGLPKSEAAFIKAFAEWTQRESIYLGNSLPIREWDLSAETHWQYQQIYGHRGANGIDGQLSGFLGTCQNQTRNWCLLGDLTTLYDLAAPWAISQIAECSVNLVIVNNSGGQIFQPMFGHPGFINAHQLQFSYWAKMWNAHYELVTDADQLKSVIERSQNGFQVIELRPDSEQSSTFWKAYKDLC